MEETVLIIRYLNIHIKEVEIGKACGTHGRERNALTAFEGNLKERGSLIYWRT